MQTSLLTCQPHASMVTQFCCDVFLVLYQGYMQSCLCPKSNCSFSFSQILPALCVLIYHTDINVSIELNNIFLPMPVLDFVCFKIVQSLFTSLRLDTRRHSVGSVLSDGRRKRTNPDGHWFWSCSISCASPQPSGGESSGKTLFCWAECCLSL